MRIAFFVDAFPALSETFILNQITGLIDRGHDVDIYASRRGDASKVHPDVVKYRLLERTHYRPSMPRSRILRVLKGADLALGHVLRNPVLILRSLNAFKYGKRAASLELLYAMVPLLRARPYEIIHCHFGPNGTRAALLRDIGALTGNLITVFHGYDLTMYIRSSGERVYDALFKAGDLFLPISERWRRRLIELGCDERKTLVHRMGIDCTRLSFRPRRPAPDGIIRLVTVARLVEKKGVEYGIRAVARLRKTHANLEYNIVGDGPLGPELRRLVDELDAAATVKLLGWKHQEEAAEILGESHIMVAPSVTAGDGDQEGIPVVLMEAMALGLPIVSTLHSGIPELVEDGLSGFLVAERDVDALADRLSHLLEHPETWPGMGKAGRAFVEANYNIDKLNDRLVEIYQSLPA
jgi:colanic acid/amylovoran biosynthesis glycosyltransferase